MPNPTRAPFLAYLLVHTTMLRRRCLANPETADRLEDHVHALELLADLVRALPEDDERLLVLGTLVVRGGQFAPGPASEHALTHFAGISREACDTFLTSLVQIARDDALARARAQGHLPPRRPS